MIDAWKTVEARDLRVGDVIIRNVVEGMEWVPGPYGAFRIITVVMADDHDDVKVWCRPAWEPHGFTGTIAMPGGERVGLDFLTDEQVVIKRMES